MNPAILAVTVMILGASGAAFAKSDQSVPFELEKIVVTPSNGGTLVATMDSDDLAVGDSQTVVTASGAVISLRKKDYGVEIYVDGDLLGISEHLAIP